MLKQNIYSSYFGCLNQLVAVVLFLVGAPLCCAAESQPGVSSTPSSPIVLPAQKEDERSFIQDQELFFVPPLTDRPLGADEGERLIVRAFALRGVLDRPEFGTYVEDIVQILETERIKKQHLAGDTVEGFTPGALAQSAKILRELVQRRDSGESTPEDIDRLNKLVERLRDDEFNPGLTIGQLQEIADDVTRYYRSKGFILAQAYLPAQTIQNGIVIVQVLEGTLSDIVVEGNKRYSSEWIKEPFEELIGMPVVKQPLENALLRLTDYPGLTAFGVFRPGKDIGSAQLVLTVEKEKRAGVNIAVDNYGSEFTGEFRTLLGFEFNNLANIRDRFFGTVYKTFDPNNGLYGILNYEVPVPNISNILGVKVSRNEFTMDATTASVAGEGDTTIGGLYWWYTFERSRKRNQYLRINFDRKRADVELEPIEEVARDDLAVLSLEYQYDSISPRTAGINTGYFRYSHGFDGILGVPSDSEREKEFNIRLGSTAQFDKFDIGYMRIQSINPSNSLMVKLRGQYSDDILVSLEQQALGGPDSVRAYPVARYLRDKGYYGSIEWIVKAPGFADREAIGSKTWGDILQMSIFYDIGGGTLNSLSGGDTDSITIQGLGFGFTGKWSGFFTRFDFAWPIDLAEQDEDLNGRVYFTASYGF